MKDPQPKHEWIYNPREEKFWCEVCGRFAGSAGAIHILEPIPNRKPHQHVCLRCGRTSATWDKKILPQRWKALAGYAVCMICAKREPDADI
jgi:hypothetical protein